MGEKTKSKDIKKYNAEAEVKNECLGEIFFSTVNTSSHETSPQS